MSNPIDMTTLANAKSWLKSDSTIDDGVIQSLITNCSQAILNHLSWGNESDRGILSATRSEAYDGLGNKQMTVNYSPVTAISSLTIDTVVIPASANPLLPGFVFSGNRIMLRGGFVGGQYGFCALDRFSQGFQNVLLTYTAGYASYPFDIAQACMEWVAIRYRDRERIGEKTKIIGQQNVSYDKSFLPDVIKNMLLPYKRLFIS